MCGRCAEDQANGPDFDKILRPGQGGPKRTQADPGAGAERLTGDENGCRGRRRRSERRFCPPKVLAGIVRGWVIGPGAGFVLGYAFGTLYPLWLAHQVSGG